jgi:hypothetical protein
MTNAAQWNVRGHVQTLQTEFAEWDLTREEWQAPRHSNLAHFHRDGRISGTEHHNPDGSISRSSYNYDETGRLTETQSRMDDGPIHRTIYHYDDSGRLIRTVRVDENGIQRDSETYSYDEGGRKTKVQIPPRLEPNTDYFFGIEGTELGYGATDAATMTTLYNDSQQPAEALFHDANHRLLRRVIFTRDSAGRLVKEEMQLGTEQTPFPEFEKALENAPPEERAQAAAMLANLFGANRIMSSTTNAYDENGRRVEGHVRMGEMWEERKTYRFDEHDNPIGETTEQIRRDMNPDEAGNLPPSNEISTHQQVRFEYQYDAHGNWTERVVSVRLEQNPDFQRSNVERRKISYYPA